MRKLVVLSVAVVAATASATNTAQAKSGKTFLERKCMHVSKAVKFWRSAAWKWQERYDHTYTRSSYYDKKTVSCRYGMWLAHLWQKRAKQAKAQFWTWYKRTYAKWECIHNHEAAWNGDNNPTYDGGLQMDVQFQTTYGKEFYNRWGNAEHWPVWSQLIAAERAYRTRGFGPWPTRQYCGV